MLASFLEDSSVTAMDYAIRVRDMVLALLFLPISALSDVGLSEKSAMKDMKAFGREMTSMLNWTSFLMLPAACLLSVFATDLISILFMRGNFGPDSAGLVGRALVFYAPWLAQFGFGAVVSRGFYALKDSRTPVLIGVWGMVVNVLLNIMLIGPMGIGGLALASTIASTSKTVLLTWFFRRKAAGISFGRVGSEHLKLISATVVSLSIAMALKSLLPSSLDDGMLHRLSRIVTWAVPSLAGYLGVCSLLGSDSVRTLAARFRRTT
jgi:putative peptidoglycan lipid II flippase